MFNHGDFIANSGKKLSFKIECDDLTDSDIECMAFIVGKKFTFREVIGVPTGGLRLAKALEPYVSEKGNILVVDDVLTTGASMEKYRTPDSVGVVIFSRGICPEWIYPIFKLSSIFI
jgi:orotate phosphoribosyltransferase